MSPSAAPASEVFAALADPTRWEVLRLLATTGDGSATTIAARMPVSRPAVIKHLAVLDRAGLVERRRAGREVLYGARPARIAEAADALAAVAAAWDDRLAALKRLAEAGEAGSPDPA
jgi:DNA-binding transcriptional ArsR family regulator